MTLIDTMFNTYGLNSLLVGLLFVIIIWLISHFSSKPGGQVSVLWGLTSYERKEVAIKMPEIISALNNNTDKSESVLIAHIDDYLIVDTETQRASYDLTVFKNGVQLNQLAIVVITLELTGSKEIPLIQLHLKRKRPGKIISGIPQILGDVNFVNSGKVSSLGMIIELAKMRPGEKFRTQLVTDGLRASDFHLVQEPKKSVDLRIAKSEDWQP